MSRRRFRRRSARTLPGTPAVALGRNRFIAWGATNVAADVEDLYRERLDADRHARRIPRRAGAARGSFRETIAVKGARAGARSSVRITRHGPLVSDAINANNARVEGDAEAAAARAARVPVDRARPGRRHD